MREEKIDKRDIGEIPPLSIDGIADEPLVINKLNPPTATSAMVDAGDGGMIEDGGICVHMDLDPRNLMQIAAIQLANREKEIARLVSKDMKSESQIRADQAELWEKYQIVSLNIPRGDVVMDTPKVGTHFYIPGEFAKVTEPGEWKFGWIKYPATDRFQILTIHRRNLLAILAGKIRITNLPPEAAITAIADDFRRYAICLRVSHPSFEVVADGMEARCFLAEFEAILPSE